MNVKNILVSTLLFSLSFIAVAASENESFELPKIKVIPIQDSQTERQYELYIKLPEGYSKAENKDKDYPVIYITDAMWHMEILSGSTEYIMEDAILVGISWQKDIKEDLKQKYGAHASRFRDYSFWKKSNPEHPKLQFGQANNHLAFIRNDVFNHIEQNYRANPDNRSYFGYSLSGLFGAYILMTQPDTFKNYILGSPSIQLLTEGEEKVEFKNKELNANVFISNGTLEKKSHEPISEFVTLLRARNNSSLSIEHAVIEGSHHTAFPMTGLRSVTWLSNLIKDDELQVLNGPYLGQKPPGLIPEVFAPGIVSKEHRDWTGSFSPDMKRYNFGRNNSETGKTTTVVFKSENNRWYESIAEPRVRGFISPDGKTMHSGKRFRERTDDGWSELKSLGSPFEEIGIMTLTASSKATYVFDEMGKNGNGVLRYSRLIDGTREAPRPFSNEINRGTWTAHPFIASDESYIIWDSENDGGYGAVDLYISFRQQDGSWGAAINFGDNINTEGPDSGGYVSPDGKYFFFNRKISPEDSDVYWVDAQIIEMLRPKQ